MSCDPALVLLGDLIDCYNLGYEVILSELQSCFSVDLLHPQLVGEMGCTAGSHAFLWAECSSLCLL